MIAFFWQKQSERYFNFFFGFAFRNRRKKKGENDEGIMKLPVQNAIQPRPFHRALIKPKVKSAGERKFYIPETENAFLTGSTF